MPAGAPPEAAGGAASVSHFGSDPLALPSAPALLARALVLLHAPARRGAPAQRLLELLPLLAPALHPSLPSARGDVWVVSTALLAPQPPALRLGAAV
jgi:hypothetical protein